MRIAIAQMPGVELRAWQDTQAQIDRAIAQAADEQADLVVLPECVWPAYCLGSRAAYDATRGAGMPGPDAFLAHLRTLARRRGIAVCAGYVDETGDAPLPRARGTLADRRDADAPRDVVAHDRRDADAPRDVGPGHLPTLRNAACLIDADGNLLGVRHKTFLWAFDREVFEPGDVLEPIDTPFGRAGLLICADARLPEIVATLVNRGATLLLQPTAWVNAGTPEEPWNPQPDFLIRSRAAEFGVPCASASKVGEELETTFVGGSLICDADGQIVAQCGDEPWRILVAEVEPRTPARSNVSNAERLALLADARPATPAVPVPPLEIFAGVGDALPKPGPAGRLRLLVRPPAKTPDETAANEQAGGIAVVAGPRRALLEHASALGALVADEAVQRFAPLRVSALQGIHFACVFGDGADGWHVRARACENRIFVVWSRTDGVAVVDPRGKVVAESAWPPARHAPARVCELDLSVAANREVAWRTNVLADRRPGLYVL